MNPQTPPLPRTCAFCGSNDLILGVPVGQSAEVGSIGPKYKTGFLLVGTEPLHLDLCRACGTVQRFYVKDSNRNWIQ